METVILIVGIVNAVLLLVILIKLLTNGKPEIDTGSIISAVKDGLSASQRELREEMANSVQSSVRTMGDSIGAVQKSIGENQADRLDAVSKRITQMQTDVNAQLDAIRKIVDDRLQSTMEEKMAGFRTAVSELHRQSGDAQKTQLDTMDKKLSDSLTAMSRAVQDKMDILEKRFQSLETSVKENLQTFGSLISESQQQSGQAQKAQLDMMHQQIGERLDGMKRTVSEHLTQLSETNQRKLDGIQSMVSDKLESRLRESFNAVSERLEQVHKSLGEMQTIASGVGDLKKVLSNVKTRGILGEIQLGMILDEILAPDQYEHEIPTIPGSSNHVEYAVRLPGADGNSTVYLPIDSKFPGDTFRNLQDAYDSGDSARIAEAKKRLELTVKGCAADIRNKYVEPPYTTNFGVMFLPFEGLYAEVVNSGLVDVLQREYSITVAGPSTMAAMLNSLQMGFRTLAIQKRSNEVWKILGEAKGEFEKFETALKSTQKRITQAGEELEKLVGTRTRAINRKLRSVEALDTAADTPPLLFSPDDDE